MIDKFEEILKELSIELTTPLHVDENNACLIVFDEKINVQLELDETLENLIIFSLIYSLPPGKYRENVLLEALKENDKFPYIAVFAYFEPENSLALFNILNLSNLNSKTLVSYLLAFRDLALIYQNSLIHGQTSPIST
jgi:hypothetical protein